MSISEYVTAVLSEFGGGGGGPQNDLVRFGLGAIFFAILFAVAWWRQRQGDYPREKLLVWGFGLGFARELFMFTMVSFTMLRLIEPAKLETFFPPFEHALRSVAVVFIAGAFLRYILDDARIARRYLQVWIGVTVLCYLVVVWPWAMAVRADPSLRFGMHWGVWAFRLVGVLSLTMPVVVLTRARGWVRNVAIVAIACFFLDDFLMLVNLATDEQYGRFLGPLSHNLHIWAIPLLGYVYFREQAHELQQAQAALETYSAQLEEMVAARTVELKERTEQLEQQTLELSRARDAAEVASRAKSEFLSNMNHELRSPLNAILGFTRISARSGNLPQDVQENLGIIMRSGEHLLTLINQVLDLAKIEAGRTTLRPVECDLHHLLDTVEDMFALAASSKGLDLCTERTGDLPRVVRADEVKLRQVLINLLSNAVKFTARGSVRLRVATCDAPVAGASSTDGQAPDHRLCFEVVDTGPGIPAEEQERIFETFTQTSTGQQMEGGTGLGLSISRDFVQLMGGTLTVESPAPSAGALPITAGGDGAKAGEGHVAGQRTGDGQGGPGAVFRFDIPVYEGAGDHVAVPESTEAVRVVGLAPDQPGYRILVVDDKAANRQLLAKLLTPIGFAVREAADGREALAVWEAWKPHLIWMDMRMPVMDGYEATTRIKATTQGQATVIVALTASAFEEERAIVISAGCDDFLRKPFREADIFAMMKQHLGVRYRYAPDTAEATAPATHLTMQEIMAALNGLPADVRTGFKAAVAAVDIEALEAVIQQIALVHEQLAADLAQFVHTYDYEQLEKFFEQTSDGHA